MNQCLWQPDDVSIQNSTLSQFLSKSLPEKKFACYADLHQWSIDNREYFWQSVWEYFDVKYSKNWQTILDEPKGIFMAKWFKGSQLNFSENLLRYRDEKIAIEFHNESGQQKSLSYKSLFKQVAILADAFKRNGLKKGDRVAAVLPNIPETVIAMLACTSIGAIWSSSSPDFGTTSLVDRFGQIKPKILLYSYAYCYKGKCYDCIDKIDALVKKIPFEQTIAIAYGRLPELAQETPENSKKPPIGIGYQDYIHNSLSIEDIDFVQSDFDHPVYILYSSGTTGVPKCIVHGAGGTLLQHCKELGLHVDLKRQDKLFYYTSTGWMMWNWQVSALALGATLVLYDGCPFYPHPTSLLDLVSTQRISIFGCSAKYIASLEKTGVDVKDKIKLTSLRMILSTGSPLAAESFDYIYKKVKSDVQLCSISGGTDIISCFALGNPLSSVFRGELQGPGLGMAVKIFDENGQAVIEQKGELVCTASFPSMPVCFWNDSGNKKYHRAYFEGFPGVWTHGDFAEINAHLGIVIYGRSDATLNPGGVRIGTAEIYRQLEPFAQIEDALAIAQRWNDDQRIILFVQLVNNEMLGTTLIEKIKQHIRNNTSPHHVPAKIIQIHDIPKTYNGKLAELAVINIIHNQPVMNLSALVNPDSLEEYKHLEQLKR